PTRSTSVKPTTTGYRIVATTGACPSRLGYQRPRSWSRSCPPTTRPTTSSGSTPPTADELIVADPTARTVTCWALDGTAYRQTGRSERLAVPATELEAAISWP